MSSASETYDLVIVGGGITGAGIARDAQLRGLRVALFEKDDFGSGTSSKSSKLVHGGLRYLEQGELMLVFESVSERGIQRRLAPHLVRPVPFLIPIYKGGRVGLETMNLGLWMYELLALFRVFKKHRIFRGAAKASQLEPGLLATGLRGALEYYDCFTDDARLVLENVVDAANLGADCHSYTEVIGLARERGRVRTVTVRDRLTGEERTVQTNAVFLATGPWTDKVIDQIGVNQKGPILRPTKGVHLVFPTDKLKLTRVMTLMSPIDGRVMFVIPWRDRLVVGTTDTDFHGDPDDVHANRADAEYICESANHFFPEANFTPEDAIASWAGLRPLIHADAESASEVSREHQIYAGEDGVMLIAGGKLTTYRIMASQAVESVIRYLDENCGDALEGKTIRHSTTKRRPLPGAVGLARPDMTGLSQLRDDLASRCNLDKVLIEHLIEVYGSRAVTIVETIIEYPEAAARMVPDLPHLWAEVDHAIEFEHVRTVDDILSRRIPLLLIGKNQGLDVADRVADKLASARGWSVEEREDHLAHYREAVANSRRFKDENVKSKNARAS